jgi:hypothetical protein
LVKFIVSPNGEVVNGEILRSPRLGMAIELVKVMKRMPKWTSGKRNEIPTLMSYTLPVAFSL